MGLKGDEQYKYNAGVQMQLLKNSRTISYKFAYNVASVRRLSETAKSLGAVGFILAVESPSLGAKFDPILVGIPGIVIKEVHQT